MAKEGTKMTKNNTKQKTKEINNKESNNENKKPNKLIIVLIIILIIVTIISIIVTVNNKKKSNNNINLDNNEEKSIVNTKKDVVKDQEIEGITFSDVTLISQNNQTLITVDLTNNNTTDFHIEEVHIFLKDKEGNNMVEYLDEEDNIINYLIGYVGDTLKVGEKRTVVSSIDVDITTTTYSLEYEIIK